jgi:hypothetical protein
MPLSIGRIGYLGAFRRIRSAIGSEISGQLLSGYTVKGINIGGGFLYGNYNMLNDSGIMKTVICLMTPAERRRPRELQ